MSRERRSADGRKLPIRIERVSTYDEGESAFLRELLARHGSLGDLEFWGKAFVAVDDVGKHHCDFTPSELASLGDDRLRGLPMYYEHWYSERDRFPAAPPTPGEAGDGSKTLPLAQVTHSVVRDGVLWVRGRVLAEHLRPAEEDQLRADLRDGTISGLSICYYSARPGGDDGTGYISARTVKGLTEVSLVRKGKLPGTNLVAVCASASMDQPRDTGTTASDAPMEVADAALTEQQRRAAAAGAGAGAGAVASADADVDMTGIHTTTAAGGDGIHVISRPASASAPAPAPTPSPTTALAPMATAAASEQAAQTPAPSAQQQQQQQQTGDRSGDERQRMEDVQKENAALQTMIQHMMMAKTMVPVETQQLAPTTAQAQTSQAQAQAQAQAPLGKKEDVTAPPQTRDAPDMSNIMAQFTTMQAQMEELRQQAKTREDTERAQKVGTLKQRAAAIGAPTEMLNGASKETVAAFETVLGAMERTKTNERDSARKQAEETARSNARAFGNVVGGAGAGAGAGAGGAHAQTASGKRTSADLASPSTGAEKTARPTTSSVDHRFQQGAGPSVDVQGQLPTDLRDAIERTSHLFPDSLLHHAPFQKIMGELTI